MENDARLYQVNKFEIIEGSVSYSISDYDAKPEDRVLLSLVDEFGEYHQNNTRLFFGTREACREYCFKNLSTAISNGLFVDTDDVTINDLCNYRGKGFYVSRNGDIVNDSLLYQVNEVCVLDSQSEGGTYNTITEYDCNSKDIAVNGNGDIIGDIFVPFQSSRLFYGTRKECLEYCYKNLKKTILDGHFRNTKDVSKEGLCDFVGNNGLDINSDGTLIGYYGNDSTLFIPEGVTNISPNAFDYCLHLKSVVIPDSLTFIGENCFPKSTIILRKNNQIEKSVMFKKEPIKDLKVKKFKGRKV